MHTTHTRAHHPGRIRRRRRTAITALLAATGIATLLPAAPAAAVPILITVTSRASVGSADQQVPHDLGTHTLLSNNGRFVAFDTDAALVPADTNGSDDVYVRDRLAGTTTRVSLTDADGQIGGWSGVCGMSGDARFVAFAADGPGLPVPDSKQLYLRDRLLGTTSIVSVSSGGTPAGPGAPEVPSINAADPCPVSDNGRFVAFASSAGNLVGGDASFQASDVFRRDLQNSETLRISVSTAGAASNAHAGGPTMSADGNVIAFVSGATNLVASDTNGTSDVFVRTVSVPSTVRASLKANGTQVFGGSGSPSLSFDGTKVAFSSNATDLVPGDPLAYANVYVKTLAGGAIVRASVDAGGFPLGANSSHPSLSDDGKVVTFETDLPDGPNGDANNVADVYRKDLTSGALTTVSTSSGGTLGNKASSDPNISGDGTAVAFRSLATNLVRSDTNGTEDVFVQDRTVNIAPFASTSALVRQQFVDFLGRQPSAAELTDWNAKLTSGEKSPDELIDDLAHGTTFAGKRAPLIRLYWAFFLRAPDQNGLNYWIGKLEGGKSLASVAAHFAKSSEFQTKYGSKTNAEFVTLIYQNIFDRDPDPSGLAYWTNKLATKQKTRGDVMVNFSESSEGKRVLAPQTDTILHYLGMLKTMPSNVFLSLVLSGLKGEWISAEQVENIRDSSGYAARITP